MTITESYLGSNCTGNNSETNRVLTLSNTNLTVDGGFLVVVSTATLHPLVDFTISHLASSSTITFLNRIFNSQPITVSYEISIATSDAGAGVLPLGGQLINNEIVYFGTNITLRTVTDSSYSKWGDPTESNSDATKKAFVQILTQEDQAVKDGIFQTGDKLFWFQGSETNIERGNKIQHNSNWYEIIEIIPHEAMGTIYIIEARTKKV